MSETMTDIEPMVTVVNGRAMVSSVDVARRFGKLHKNVLRSVDNLLKEEPKLYGLNFEPIQSDIDLGMGRVRQERAYYMDRDGFMLLAMGFTGREALRWKLKFIEAFNLMEARLHALDDDDMDFLPVAADRRLWNVGTAKVNAAARMIAVVNRIYGPEGARRLYELEPGLPPMKGVSVGEMSGSPTDDPRGCLKHLLRCNSGKARSLADLIRGAQTSAALAAELNQCGILIRPDEGAGFIAIAATNRFLAQAFAETQWDLSWDAALARLPGCRMGAARQVAGTRTKVVLVPRGLLGYG